MTGPMLLGFAPPPAEEGADAPGPPPVPAASRPAPTQTQTQTQSLYRRYRPQSFDADDLVGQEHIVRTLRNAVERDRVAHAYLFCGPRGTGKTTTARLLAKAVNCLDPDPRVRPCNRCAACLAINGNATTDVIEIDAASNRGIDDIRDLRERVKYAPTQLRSKFYIIDEAHQITGAAGNAFLKTLEEPPAHTKFVLATTDPEDLLPTIVSRCQRFDFRRIALPAAVSRLRTVAEAEHIAVDDDALTAIARAGTGSLRDSLGLLDQLSVYQESGEATAVPPTITADSVRALLGVSRNDRVETIARALADRDVSTALGVVNGAIEAGEDPRQLNRQLVTYLRVLMHQLAGGSPDADETARELAGRFDLYDVARMAQRFSETDVRIRHASIAQLPFEVALVESILRPAAATATAPEVPVTRAAATTAAPARVAPDSGQAASPPSGNPSGQRPPPVTPRRPVATHTPARPTGDESPPVPEEPEWMREADPPQPVARPAPAAPPGPSLKDRVRNHGVRMQQGQPAAPDATPSVAPVDPPPVQRAAPRDQPSAAAPGTDPAGDLSVARIVELWGRIRQDVKLQNRRIEALLAEVDPIAVTGELVTLRAAYPFHRNRLEEDEVRELVQLAIGKRAGQPVRVQTVLKGDEPAARLQLTPTPPAPAPIATPPPVHPPPAPAGPAPTHLHDAPAPSVPAQPTYADDANGVDAADIGDPRSDGEDEAGYDEQVIDAARTIFDAEDVPDPLEGREG